MPKNSYLHLKQNILKMKKLIALAFVSSALFMVSCGDDKEGGGDDKKAPKMSVCDCKTFQDKFLEEFNAGDVSANELNEQYRAEKGADQCVLDPDLAIGHQHEEQ